MSAAGVRTPLVASVLTAALAAACSSGAGSMGSVIEQPPPVTAPPRFTALDSAARVAPTDTLAGPGCLSPMVDPITGLQIILLRSESGLGDYKAPSGSYGMRDDQLIRLECNTGKVLGIVRR